MTLWTKNIAAVLAFVFFCSAPCASLRAEDEARPLPGTVNEIVKTPLAKVGEGTYRKLGFRVYDASLWAPQSTWDAGKPYALQLCYTRDLSKETLIDTVMDDIGEQKIADETTLAKWKAVLDTSLSDVKDGDALVGVTVPGKKTLLLHNGVAIVTIEDQAFSNAFFSIWLGKNADEDLRSKLLGGSQLSSLERK